MTTKLGILIGVAIASTASAALAQRSPLGVELGVRGPTSEPLSAGRGLPAAPQAGLRLTPFRGKTLSLGLEIVLTARATAVDSVSLAQYNQLCSGPGGVTVICGSRRSTHKESAMQLGLALSLTPRPAPVFVDAAAGYYSPRIQQREDAWDTKGQFLPNLSFQGRPRAAGGIYTRLGLGVRRALGTNGPTVTGTVRYRWARVGGVFFLPDEYPDRRNGFEIVVGVGL